MNHVPFSILTLSVISFLNHDAFSQQPPRPKPGEAPGGGKSRGGGQAGSVNPTMADTIRLNLYADNVVAVDILPVFIDPRTVELASKP